MKPSDALPAPRITDEPTPQDTGAETLRVVEDQDQLRRLLSRRLRDIGYTVLEANDGASALRIASGHADIVHLLITDVILPGMNGRELYNRLRGEYAAMKVLFMSGYDKRRGEPDPEAIHAS